MLYVFLENVKFEDPENHHEVWIVVFINMFLWCVNGYWTQVKRSKRQSHWDTKKTLQKISKAECSSVFNETCLFVKQQISSRIFSWPINRIKVVYKGFFLMTFILLQLTKKLIISTDNPQKCIFFKAHNFIWRNTFYLLDVLRFLANVFFCKFFQRYIDRVKNPKHSYMYSFF